MNLSKLTIQEAAKGLGEKQFSSVELTQSCLDAIKKNDAGVKAYTFVDETGALAQAKKADEVLSKKEPGASPLLGVPAALKDVFSAKGLPNSAGSKILKGFVPPFDATSVSRLKEAGMVILGKTNTDEFTCGSSTETSCYGTSHNPWNLEHSPGGSSGGSSAAVAADECIYAMGTDTGGSIRQPAAYTGITGLKVTYGRVSRFGVISMASSLDTIGPMTKDVYDAALVMNAIAGQDKFDSTTPDVAVPDYVAGLKDASVKGLKIGIPKEYFIEGMDPEVEASVRAAMKEYEKAGATLHEVSLPHTKYGLAVYYILCPSEVSANMARYDGIRMGPGPADLASVKSLEDYYLKARGEGFGDEVKRRIMMGTYVLSAGYYDAYYLKAQKVRTKVIEDFTNAFKTVDVMLTPTTPTPAFKIGQNTADPIKMYLEDIFTVCINIAGVPALAIPCGFSKTGLPIGMQLIGPHFSEDMLMKVGHAYQLQTDWHKKRAI